MEGSEGLAWKGIWPPFFPKKELVEPGGWTTLAGRVYMNFYENLVAQRFRMRIMRVLGQASPGRKFFNKLIKQCVWVFAGVIVQTFINVITRQFITSCKECYVNVEPSFG